MFRTVHDAIYGVTCDLCRHGTSNTLEEIQKHYVTVDITVFTGGKAPLRLVYHLDVCMPCFKIQGETNPLLKTKGVVI